MSAEVSDRIGEVHAIGKRPPRSPPGWIRHVTDVSIPPAMGTTSMSTSASNLTGRSTNVPTNNAAPRRDSAACVVTSYRARNRSRATPEAEISDDVSSPDPTALVCVSDRVATDSSPSPGAG